MKKGFTLIELLGVIFLIGIFALITFYVVGDLISTSASRIYIKTESILVETARNYVLSSDFVFPAVVGEHEIIEGSILEDNGMISKIVDPNDQNNFCSSRIYVLKESDNSYKYIPYLNCGSNYTTVLPPELNI